GGTGVALCDEIVALGQERERGEGARGTLGGAGCDGSQDAVHGRGDGTSCGGPGGNGFAAAVPGVWNRRAGRDGVGDDCGWRADSAAAVVDSSRGVARIPCGARADLARGSNQRDGTLSA